MGMPPDYLLPFLQSIEKTVIRLYREFPKLSDKDVEAIYEKLGDYFKKVHNGKDVEEPLFGSTMKQALSDEILNQIDIRREKGLDEEFINSPGATKGGRMIPSLPMFYVLAFKELQSSARFWRKEKGPKGYLTFISEEVI